MRERVRERTNRYLSISIDVDPVPCYYRIYGLGPAPDELRDVVLRRCVPRFAELLARRRIPATFFVVGEDADLARGAPAKAARALLGELVRAGHELGNHSHTHPYEMARLGPEQVAREIGACDDVLRAVAGRAPAGFRAPGYDLSPVMLAELARRGYTYDSSIFPAPGYYAVKAAVMAGLALVGRPSGAVMTNPRALTAPADPYRPSMEAPWRRGQAPLVELPVAVTPWLRAPAIGTSLVMTPAWLRDRVVSAMGKRRFFNLELHGIDLCGADEDGIPGELVARQADLRRPLADKLAALDAVLDRALHGAEAVTLRDAAAWVHREVA
jgi:peptidoglycan/xylan/chitin deacetylase (PgdA/CDA1 family)